MRYEVYCVCISVTGGAIFGRNSGLIGRIEKGSVGSEVCVEVDLRSEEKEQRTIRYIVDGKLQKYAIVGLGREIRFGV